MATIRRNLKNTVNNYTDIQCKVREATCNEPWGPPASVMTEIADATYSVVDFAEIMSMVWKRLNDSGKNWRHVYKALVVLEYIVKTGSERVGQQCKEQIYSLLTLQDFRFVDKDNKDHGQNVRDKAKQLVALLKDEERLKQERAKSLQAKERFAQNSVGIGSQPPKPPKSGTLGLGMLGGRGDRTPDRPRPHNSNSSSSGGAPVPASALEQARPTDRDEEEMQLELALAISKEEAEKDKEERDILRQTLERSKTETRIEPKPTLLSMAQAAPPPPPPSVSLDPWGLPLDPAKTPTNDPWAPTSAAPAVPTNPFPTNNMPNLLDDPPTYSTIQTTRPAEPNLLLSDSDPWGTGPQGILQPQSINADILSSTSTMPVSSALDDFDPFSPGAKTTSTVPEGFQINSTSSTTLPPSSKMAGILDGQAKHLVNIDNLISAPQQRGNTNPFGVPNNNASVFAPSTPSNPTNPFLGMNAPAQPQPTLNQLRGPPNSNTMDSGFGHPPVSSSNPFC